MSFTSPSINFNLQKGFSLMELAVVLLIIGTLMSGVLVAVGQTRESTLRTNALAQLRQIEDALYGYVLVNGRLPCPANAVSGGREVAVGAECTLWYGFVPVTTLGLNGSVDANDLLVDPWRNPYRYAVGQFSHGGTPVFTSTANLKTFYNSVTALSTVGMLRVCSTTACNPDNIISDIVPAIIISMGANWTGFSSTEEEMNACIPLPTPPDTCTDFISTDYSEELFDDQLVWVSPYILINKLVNAGRLP